MALPSPIVVQPSGNLDELLSMEWLLTNKLGCYAASTPIGCNTRRYHGLLIAATIPPVGRINALSTVMEQLTIDGKTHHLAVNEFPGAFSPRGYEYLRQFSNDVAPTYVYNAGGAQLVKEIAIADGAAAVAIRYTLRGKDAKLVLWPFAALRDFHSLRKVHEPHQITYKFEDGGVAVQDMMAVGQALHLTMPEAMFLPRAQWWYRFLYRQDIARGQDGYEDLYTPGSFTIDLSDGQSCQLTASLGEPVQVDFDTATGRRRERLEELVLAIGADADELTRQLAVASDAYVAQRDFPGLPPSPTILAGFPWFADWGRDTFISLPGLLLCTGRLEHARGVFKTFAGRINRGIVPNRFDDYSTTAHYNSIDASLWFIIAAERYMRATGDEGFWRQVLMPAADSILKNLHDGTLYDIRADADGLLTGGSHTVQLTWMDAKLGDEVITPRHGKPVEVNALWHSAHRIMANRCKGIDAAMADRYAHRAELIAKAFVQAFWNNSMGCLYDVVGNGGPDASLRPNQIMAVSLPYSPLSREQQRAVFNEVKGQLLTPVGLRTLSPFDSRYRRRYGGSWESRDRAYHQGTVWPWLIGPFVEAYLKIEDAKPFALAQARQWLDGFGPRLRQAGLGHISEVHDGDPPHHPGGCFAQAWSVAEVLRVRLLIDSLQHGGTLED